MLVFDDLNPGDEITLRLKWCPESFHGEFQGFKRYTKDGRVVYRLRLVVKNGAMICPRTCDILPGSIYLVGSYRALE